MLSLQVSFTNGIWISKRSIPCQVDLGLGSCTRSLGEQIALYLKKCGYTELNRPLIDPHHHRLPSHHTSFGQVPWSSLCQNYQFLCRLSCLCGWSSPWHVEVSYFVWCGDTVVSCKAMLRQILEGTSQLTLQIDHRRSGSIRSKQGHCKYKQSYSRYEMNYLDDTVHG